MFSYIIHVIYTLLDYTHVPFLFLFFLWSFLLLHKEIIVGSGGILCFQLRKTLGVTQALKPWDQWSLEL